MDDVQLQDLKNLLVQRLHFDCDVDIESKKLSGGAIQENWLIIGKKNHVNTELVLRKNSETSVDASSDREQEYRLLKRLHQLNITVPQPLLFEKKNNFLNSDFFMMEKISGIAEGHKLVRLRNSTLQQNILKDIGERLADLHQIENDDEIESILEKPQKESYLIDLITDLYVQLDKLKRHRPVLEFALSWMKQAQPTVDDLVLVHGDYRTGNIMIEDDHVSGILDWEFSHWGDRREDIGWFTAKCWRFGQDQNIAGGIGAYKDFMHAYAQRTDIYIADFELKFWHVLAHVRWAIIAMHQSNRNQNNTQASLELALTEFLVPQLEKNILDIIGEKE